ncbi:MAG TPA: exodeoxyribonuclease III [Cyclobacteriaceae bacterium]|jgi:exodeoxyribonuclease-3|nr:exodeoxyribonuclease III [Cyclobacteriaceae bacterium]
MAQLHLVNWNVNGIRSIIKKDFIKDIKAMNPDVLCLQETKASFEEVKTVLELLPEYTNYVNSSKARKGYSGTAIITRTAPINVTYDMNVEEHDQEGRVITAEYENYFLVTVYVPNSGEGLKRLDYREKWNAEFTSYIAGLNANKPVIVCGDLNVAHKEIDIARPKENYNKSAGYTQKEIDGFQEMLDRGFVDTFRHFHPEEVKYTYWNYMFNARTRNVGWRIDYFIASTRLIPNLKDALIYNEYMGSDHCPVAIKLEI